MNTFTLVRPEHLNHHGYLFGGQLLKWVDEFAWLTAARDFPKETLVTRAMDNIEFKTKVVNGSILRFRILPQRRGSTSISYTVDVFANRPLDSRDEQVFYTHVTFVNVDKSGKKRKLPQKDKLLSELPETPESR
jgi:acyl-CoA hydrolase